MNENRLELIHLIDETLVGNAKDVDTLVINSSFVDIEMHAIKTDKIKVHFFGKITIDGEVEFKQSFENTLFKHKWEILPIIKGKMYKKLHNRPKLMVMLPCNKTFKSINIRSSGNIFLSSDISANKLNLESSFESIISNATFKEATISAPDGNIGISINAASNINLYLCSMTGNAIVSLSSISNINLDGNVKRSKLVDNCNRIRGGYVANISCYLPNGKLNLSNKII